MDSQQTVRLTMLNNMADEDFITSLDTQRKWGITDLDLKSSIFGKAILECSDDEYQKAADEICRREMYTWCISTGIMHAPVEKGEEWFREHQMPMVDKAIDAARYLEPRYIRLLGANTQKYAALDNTIDYIKIENPWLLSLYKEAIDRINDAGFGVTIENETEGCIFRKPTEILAFFAELEDTGNLCYTYDVQNLWQAGGMFPSMAIYRQLQPIIGYFHVKGGMAEEPDGPLVWKSSLEDASWPVAEMLNAAIADGCSPVICLNTSHGKLKDGYNLEDIVKRDIDWMRAAVKGIE